MSLEGASEPMADLAPQQMSMLKTGRFKDRRAPASKFDAL